VKIPHILESNLKAAADDERRVEQEGGKTGRFGGSDVVIGTASKSASTPESRVRSSPPTVHHAVEELPVFPPSCEFSIFACRASLRPQDLVEM
jgi:hypothetical protein